LNTNELIERQKPDVENYGLDYYSAYDEGIKNMLTKEGKLGKLGIGASVYQMKKEDIDRIRKMPEGPAKEAAWEDFLLNAATSTAYGLSDEGIGKSVEKARKTQLAQIPGKTKEAEATTLARGGAEAKTPQFVAERKKEWERTLGDYNEAYQQYSLGRNAPDNATGDVAIVNALEKVREINSAVMYGDYEKWQKANNLVSALEQDGILGAFRRGAEKRLPPQARKDMQKLLDELFANRQTLIENARKTNIDISKRDYDWDDRRANDVFRAPKLGFQSGYTPDKATAPGTVKKTFNSVQEAEAANLPKGTVIYINGRRAVVE
jgi:hypothetical protein